MTQLVEGIDGLNLEQNPFQELETTSSTEEGVVMWAAQVTREDLSPGYLANRDQLADSAFLGAWEEVFSLLDIGRREFGETWINASRMSAHGLPCFRAPSLTVGYRDVG